MKSNHLLILPPRQPEEWVETLAQGNGCRIERIVSWGQASPDGFWYDQEEDEWLTLLQGRSVLTVEDREVVLNAGDTLLLPAHCRHRVESTTETPPCVWLCVFGHFQKEE